MKHYAASRSRIKEVCKSSFNPCALIEKRHRAHVRRNHFRKSFAVLFSLSLNAYESVALSFSFDYSHSFAINED